MPRMSKKAGGCLFESMQLEFVKLFTHLHLTIKVHNNPPRCVVSIVYYSNTQEGLSEYNAYQYYSGDGVSTYCVEDTHAPTPDWSQKGVSDSRPDSLSGITVFGDTCAYEGQSVFVDPTKKTQVGTMKCTKWRDAPCYATTGGGTCADGYQNWDPLVDCDW